MIKLVIFDFDGLMVNSEEVTYAAVKKYFKKYNHEMTWDYFLQSVGIPRKETLKKYYKDFPLPVSFEEFELQRKILVRQHLDSDLRTMPGLLPLLLFLEEKNIPMAIATSSTRGYIEEYLKRLDLRKYFPVVVCSEDVERGKPFPDLFLKVLEETEVKNTEAIVLEDSIHGVEAAHKADIFCIAVPTKGINFQLVKKADMIVHSLETINETLMRFL